MIFKGTATALITPFKDNRVDFDAFARIMDFQSDKSDAVVILGTTGEPATMSGAEKAKIIKFAVERFGGKKPVIVGAGSNSTTVAIEQCRTARDLGADALLVVTPYYNKCTQDGLKAHFFAIADSVDIPIICYNVPGRTGINMLPATFAELAENPNIAAIKEASGNMEQIEECARLTRGKAAIYSGDDGITLPVMTMGGDGVISVASNVTALVKRMTDAYFDGDMSLARDIQLALLPLIRALFCEVNPIPVKYAAHLLGLCDNSLRLPLTPLSPQNEKIMREALGKIE